MKERKTEDWRYDKKGMGETRKKRDKETGGKKTSNDDMNEKKTKKIRCLRKIEEVLQLRACNLCQFCCVCACVGGSKDSFRTNIVIDVRHNVKGRKRGIQ